MPAPDPHPASLPQSKPIYKLLIAIFILTAAGFSAIPVNNHFQGGTTKDYALWQNVGEIVLAGGTLYPTDGSIFPFMYPPLSATLLAIPALGGRLTLIITLVLINSAAWLTAILASVQLATGRVKHQPPHLYLLPSLVVCVFIYSTYLLGQPNLLLLAAMLLAFVCLQKNRQLAAGGLIAFAASIKAFPILALGYLLYRRLWKAAGSALLFLIVFLILLPACFRGLDRSVSDLATWTNGMVLRYDQGSIAQRPERGYSWKNQSLISLSNRLLRNVPADAEDNAVYSVNIADLSFKTVNLIILTAAAALCLFYIAVMPRHHDRTSQSNAIEFAMLLLLVLMFSPLSFGYFYVWLLYPLAVVLHLESIAPRSSPARVALLAVFWAVLLLLMLTIPFQRAAQAYGNYFFATLLLFLTLGWQLRQLR